MALSRGDHRFGPRVDHCRRAICVPRGKSDVGLHRKVELRTETAATRRWNDPHVLGRQSQNSGRIVAVEVGGLGRYRQLNAISKAAGPTGLRLDVGMLDEARVKLTFHNAITIGECGVRVALSHSSTDQDIAVAASMNKRGARCERRMERHSRLTRCPGYRKLGEIDFLQRAALPNDGGDRFPLEPSLALCEYRLIGIRRNHAE